MRASLRRTSLEPRSAVIMSLFLLLLVTVGSSAKPAKEKVCHECQSRLEVLIPGGRAMLDELTALAESVSGTIDVVADSDDVLAELPRSAVKTLSRKGLAVTPAKPSPHAAGQRKDGENCTSAIPVEAGVPYVGRTTFMAPEAWHSFTPAESGVFVISLAGSAFDTILTVFDACDGNVLAFNDDDGYLWTSEVSLPLEAGTTYIILVEGFWGDYGDYELLVEADVSGPGESSCTALPAELDILYEGIISATVPERWYSFTPSESGNYVISLKGSQFDTTLAIYDRTTGPTLGCNDDGEDLQSRLDIYLYEGTTYYIQVSGWEGEFGAYRLTLKSVMPPPHDTVGRAIAVSAGQVFSGSTEGAICTLASSGCSFFDSRDVWHCYVPATSGYVRITADGIDFDTTLVVFDEFRGTALACNDDVNDCSRDSSLLVDLTAGQSYLIRVAGYDGLTGPYALTLEPIIQSRPEAPWSPWPADGTEGAATSLVLSWDNEHQPPESVALASTSRKRSSVRLKGIYGRDDRRDEYQIEDARILEAGDATVVLLDRSALEPCRWGYTLTELETLDEYVEGLCPDEPFRDQPTAGRCSGFLVAPDLIATAGHCEGCGDDIKEMAAVFGYVMKDAETAETIFSADDVYFCEAVVAGQTGTPDWSLIRLDRSVVNHVPVRIRRAGFVPEQQPLLVVGHPVGMPRKYDSGGTVRDNWRRPVFGANLDTFGGNSGSAVFNLETMMVEGILVAGNSDFDMNWDSGCMYSSTCPDSGCPLWEDVVRTTTFSNLVPSYTVLLGTDPNEMTEVDTGGAAPRYTASALEPGQTYYWQIIAQNVAGKTLGPVWSFTTAP